MAAPQTGSALVKQCIIKLTGGAMMNAEEAAAAMGEIMAGSATDAQIGGWLVALRSFPDDPAVVGACAETMTNYAQKISLGEGVASVDIVGTGGDGMDTFNCSTACSFMVAACGLKVSKHGNRSASGNVGSADLLEGLGANIMLDADKVLSCIEGSGFGFLFAQKFHPAMRYVMPARKQLGVRTVFNMLGPLTNPCRPTAQLIGVGVESMAPLYASIFAARGGKTMIVHSTDGLDEISCEAPTKCWICDGGKVTEQQISPADFGLPTHSLDLVQGGTVQERVSWFREAIAPGKSDADKGPRCCAIRDFCVINAAAALWVAGAAPDWKTAASQAAAAIASGAVEKTVASYVELTNK